MPRNVRNFWIELNVDGSAKRVETGPRSADGGFSMRILQRDNGGIVTALDVWGVINDEGRIVLHVSTNGDDRKHIEVVTQR